MHPQITNTRPKHSMFTELVSSPRVRLSSLTNTQGKPQHRLLYWSRRTRAGMSLS
jgi:hypothetical protein